MSDADIGRSKGRSGQPMVIAVPFDGTVYMFVELRRYLEQRAGMRWPPVRDGKRGRPKGGPMRSLAEAMGISRSRLSHCLADAERDGKLTVSYLQRIAMAFGHVGLGDFIDHYHSWYRQLTTKETDK